MDAATASWAAWQRTLDAYQRAVLALRALLATEVISGPEYDATMQQARDRWEEVRAAWAVHTGPLRA